MTVGFIVVIILNQRRFIAQQRNQLEELSRSEQKYRNLFENSLAGVIRISLQDRRVLDANNAYLKMVGEDFEAARDFLVKLPPGDQGRLMESLYEHGVVENFETHLKRSDGSRLWISFSGRIFQAEGYVEAVMIDISTRIQAEERIREQAELLDKAQDAILVLTLDNMLVYWNRSAERLYGWTAKEVEGRKINELIYQNEVEPAFLQARDEVLQIGEWNGELRQRRKSGDEITSSCRWTLVRDSNGDPRSILMINTDITDKKSLEAQFLRAQRMESIGVMAGGMAHDLNNILSPIVISIDILKKKLNDDLSRKVIAAIETSSKRGADMLKNVLTFARGIEGDRSPIQLSKLIQELFKIASETFPRSIEMSMEDPKDLWAVLGDSTQFHQVLLNLCVNARDAMQKGGRLTIGAHNTYVDESFARMNPGARRGSYVVVSVSDTGMGIPAINKDKIFEPFFTTKAIGKGTGLGLSTALGIIKSHSGFITVESVEHKGSTFSVYLPAIGEEEPIKSEEDRPETPSGKGELVLIVDDEEPIREVGKVTLETHGYRVITANDGTEAISAFVQRSKEIKVILTDIMMPHMGGVETIRALKKIDPAVKIIATTGLTMPDEIRISEADGVQAVLLKPYTAEKLLKTLHKVLYPADPVAVAAQR